jgi:hypothetical protein
MFDISCLHFINDVLRLLKGFQFGKLTGDVVALDINAKPTLITLNKTNVPDSEQHILASPHGMTSYKDPKTGRSLLLSLFIWLNNITCFECSIMVTCFFIG